jgi:superoxide dismutase, Fe-Mn family
MNTLPPPMALALCANFGSVDAWRMAIGALAGSDDVQLVFKPAQGTLATQRRSAAAPAAEGDHVLLTLSCTSAAEAEAAVAGIDWPAVYERYQHAVHAASKAFGATRETISSALLLDVRRAGVFEQSETMLPGARWCDPAKVADWSVELPRSQPIVVYCVYGHEVGRATALRLRAIGLDARYLEGGIDGWQAAGLPLAPKGEQP